MAAKTVMKSEAMFRSAGSHTAPMSASRVATNRPISRRRKVPLFIPADQAYYWSSKWQRDEAETLANIQAGDCETFSDPSDAIRYLLSDD